MPNLKAPTYVEDCTASSGNQNCSWFTAISTAINLLLQEDLLSHPQWCQRSLTLSGNVADIHHKVSHPSTQSRSLCQHQGPGSPKVKPDDSQEMDAQQMRLWLSQAHPNTPTQLPSPGATLRVANSYNFTVYLAILAIFQGIVALKSSV